jgi:hypothetical protein
VFSIEELVEGRLEDALAARAREWQQGGTVSHDLVLDCQEMFLSLWHFQANGGIIGDIKTQNIGLNANGQKVFWDLGHGWCGPPKGGDKYGKRSGPTPLTRRTSTCHFAAEGAGSNPRGDANLFLASEKAKGGFRCMTNKDLILGEMRSQHRGRGLGRLGNGTFTLYDAEAARMRAAEAKKDPDAPLDPKAEQDEDVFQASRTALQIFHPVDWEAPGGPADWERRATAAAADPKRMLQFMLDGSPAADAKQQQPLALQRFADLFALALGPRRLRPGLIELMTQLALTVPVLPPEVEQAILCGGFAFSGGAAGHVYPGIKPTWQAMVIPPTRLLLEPHCKENVSQPSASPSPSPSPGKGGHIGVGLQAVNAIGYRQFVAFYCGTKRAHSDGVGPMDTYPSRYGVSVRSGRQKDKFSIDGFVGRKLTLQWLKDHQATGAFMNAGDWEGGLASNVRLDRHSAWTDPATGIVWIPMYAICDIAAGEFLRWKYSPVDGEGGFYTFKSAVQTTAGLAG